MFLSCDRIEILCHDINVHIPHHISPRIPSYNLRAAHESIQENWGKVITPFLSRISVVNNDSNMSRNRKKFSPEKLVRQLKDLRVSYCAVLLQYTNLATWNWRLMKTILTVCHVYDKEENYIPFDRLAPEESQPITFLKKVMPDYT